MSELSSSPVLASDPLIAASKVKGTSYKTIVFLFVLGGLSLYYINIVGQLYISEIILILLFPIVWVLRKRLLRNSWVKQIVFWGIIWFGSQVITDFLRNTPLQDRLRGWANILVFLISFLALYLILAGDIGKIKAFLFGFGIGGLLQPFIQPSIYFVADPWKFGFGPSVVLLVLLIIVQSAGDNLTRMKKWFLPLLVVGGLTVYLNARALGAITLMTALIIWFAKSKIITKMMKSRAIFLTILVFIVMVLGSGWVAFHIYRYAVQSGWLGETAKYKYDTQQGDKGIFGMLIGGRTELISSYYAILDSPLIGHGSWPRDPQYADKTYQVLLDMGYDVSIAQRQLNDYTNSEDDLIPAHSHILQAWVWAGLPGAIFWILILWMILKSLLSNFRNPGPFFILVIYFSISSGWDILFSPFNSFMRLEWALRLAVLLFSLKSPSRTTANLDMEK